MSVMASSRKIFILGVAIIWAILCGCVTGNKIASYDPIKKKLEIQSTDDKLSAMPVMTSDRRIKESITHLTVIVKKDPRDLNSLLNLAHLHLIRSEFNLAEDYCRKALHVDLKNKKAKMILAQIFFRQNKYELAKIVLNSLGGLKSRDSQILNMLGLISIAEKDPAKGLYHFKEALKINASDVAVRMNLGVLYVYYRQMRKASIEFERVLKIMPEHNDAKLHLAVVKASKGQYDVAEEMYRDILKTQISNPLALYNLAVLEKRRQQYDEAIDVFRKYLTTSVAKKASNKDVFALIDEIRAEKQAATGKVSDEEIKNMANQMGRKPSLGKNSDIAKEKVVEPTEVQGTEDDEISDLENMLK